MKIHLPYTAAWLAGLAAVCTLGLSSCVVDNSWSPAPPPGWNVFYDPDLNGCWQLIDANSMAVGGYDINYMEFEGNGYGYYYYYDRGYQTEERFAYYCQLSGAAGTSGYQLNIQYEYDSPVTMSYWFTGNRLWMQWWANGYTNTYVYQRIPHIPW
ncbi:MAG: hypothetical protein K2H75_04435 [Muribaculaceae bacterium]|nr:hypothetical protein [Muribaculaceae bacterium]